MRFTPGDSFREMLWVLLAVTAAGTPPIATLERTMCLGDCPAYRIEVFKDGRVEWEGTAYVKAVGKKSRKLGPGQLDALKAAFKKAQYLEVTFPTCSARDVPLVNLSFVEGKKKQETSHYNGSDCRSTSVLGPLTRKFEELVGADEWIGREARPAPDAGE